MSGLRLAVPLLQDYVRIAQTMRDDEIAQYLAVTGVAEYDADVCARTLANVPGPHFLLVDDGGHPVIVGGFAPIRAGVFDGWLAGSIAGWDQHWKAITLTCDRLLRQLLAQGAHRVQTVALASRLAAHEWYERGLGMTREGVHPGYFADGQTAITFARTRA